MVVVKILLQRVVLYVMYQCYFFFCFLFVLYLGIRNFADAHTCTDLKLASGHYAVTHFNEVAYEEEFLQLTKAQLLELLRSEDLNVTSEEEVYNAIIR